MIGVTLTGRWDRAQKAVASLAFVNFTALHKEIGEYLVSDTQRRFDEGIGPKGARWKPSARAKADAGQTLVDSKRLQSSIGYEARSDRVDVGTNVKYARIHQLGGTIRPKKARRLIFTVDGEKVAARKVRIPPRPFLGVNERNEREIRTIIHDAIARRAR